MYRLKLTTRFKKDLKSIKKRGLKLNLLDEVVTTLVRANRLPQKDKPHKLKGKYVEYGNVISSLIGC